MTTSTISNTNNGILKVLHKPSKRLLTTWYAEQVIKGNIEANEYVIKEAQRHINFLNRDDHEWEFDEELAHRPIRFIEKFCKPTKGNYDQLIMQGWQHFILGSLYGWVHKESRLRRFKEGLIFVARKNGKSTFVAGQSIYGASKDGERGADVILLANSMKQVRRTIFDEAKKMIKKSPSLNKRFRALRDVVHYDKTDSSIEPQASDSEKLDGLNTHLGIFDEIHEFKDYKLISVIKNSRQSRKQPLLVYITTAGEQLDGPLVKMVEQGKDVLDGLFDDDRTFYFLASLDDKDDINDSSTWIKANPNLGVSIDLEEMEEDWRLAKRDPEERADFITKRLNIFANNSEMAFLDLKTIQKNNKVIDFESLRGERCVGGYDLSNTEDFTAANIEFPLEDGSIAVLSHTWVPEEKTKFDNEKIPFKAWEEAGYLTIVPGSYIKHELVLEWFEEMAGKYNVEVTAYDPANAYRLNTEMENKGFNTQVVRQGAITLSPVLKDIKTMFKEGKVIHNNNPVLNWYLKNVRLVKDRNGNLLPSKRDRYRKIDGFAALLNSHTHTIDKLVTPKGNGNMSVVSLDDLMG